MDSENDFHGAYDDFDSLKEYYSDGDNAIDYGDDSGADDDVDADHDGTIDDSDDMPDDDDCDNKRDQKQRNYTILTEEDIRRRQEDDTTRISTVLSVSKQWATLLLCNFQWSVSRVHDEWFADEDRVCRAVGLYAEKSVAAGKRLECGICFENCLSETTHSAAGCGHRYCENCWEGYIGTSINDGPGCLFLQCPCPDPFCNAAIDQSMIDKLASDEDKKKYSRYLFRSYIEGHRKTKWCPAPGCDFAVEFSADGDGNCDVSCLCSHGFCWNCSEESHSPVDCGTVSKWLIKNSSESENMNWILANSKACPKCKRQIEKNHGCMHMTCSPPCKFEFCWLCLGPWSQHGQTTGGFYACNIYAVARKQGTLDNEAETRREMAKQSLERYMHYYERWQTNQSSMKKALADLHEAQTNQIPKLSDTLPATNLQLMFITDAWLQIIECRRVLKWTYAYGYYIPEHEHAKKEFFEYAQGLAESALEKLHNCAETDVKDFLGYEGSSEGFNDFRNKLRELTSVTKTYFSNLVSALENGLSDVYHGAYKKTARSKHSGKAKKVKT